MSRIACSRNQQENNIYVFILRYLYLYIYTLDIFSEVHLDFLEKENYGLTKYRPK